MFRQNKLRALMVALIVIALGLSTTALAVQKKDKDKEKKAPEQLPAGTAVMWRDPGDIASRDLLNGSGGAERKPDLSSLTMIEKVKTGFSEKYRVRDAAGNEWVAKVSREAQSETAASRLLWAVGYVTELTYLAPTVNIPGTPKGTYTNVRFEGRPKDVKRYDPWLWDSNPFVGKREFQGLKVMMLLLNNWDIKDDNNGILHITTPDGQSELHYIVSDLGATFGKIGSGALWALKRSRNNPEDYAGSKFIKSVNGDRVAFHYGGKMQNVFEDISVADAQWIGGLLSKLSDQQISDAFRAANYTPDEVTTLTAAVRARINELVKLSPPTSAS
ncbi:MAG TPA: hypothetical protein VGW12_18510 [Pyrinomonadaceae bacterium]|nr:hypothetical protein [Pyrinomonadaceae bacterium]